MGHGVKGSIDKISPIHRGMDPDSLREDFSIKLIYSLMHFLEDSRRVLEAEHLDDSFHAVVHFHLIVHVTQNSFSLQVTIFHSSEVFQVNRCT